MSRFAFAPAPYVSDVDAARRYSSLEAVVRRDALGRVWTDAESQGAPLL